MSSTPIKCMIRNFPHTVTDSFSADEGTFQNFDAVNMLNPLQGSFWKSQPGRTETEFSFSTGNLWKANALFLHSHNLNSVGATLELRCSVSGSDIHITPYFPPDDGPILIQFPLYNSMDWDLKLTGFTGEPFITNLWLGEILDLQYPSQGYDPNQSERISDITRSASGGVVGVHLKIEKKKLSFTFLNEPKSLYDKILDIWKTTKGTMFPVFPNIGKYPEEIFYMAMTSKFNNPLVRGSLYNIKLSLEGV